MSSSSKVTDTTSVPSFTSGKGNPMVSLRDRLSNLNASRGYSSAPTRGTRSTDPFSPIAFAPRLRTANDPSTMVRTTTGLKGVSTNRFVRVAYQNVMQAKTNENPAEANAAAPVASIAMSPFLRTSDDGYKGRAVPTQATLGLGVYVLRVGMPRTATAWQQTFNNCISYGQGYQRVASTLGSMRLVSLFRDIGHPVHAASRWPHLRGGLRSTDGSWQQTEPACVGRGHGVGLRPAAKHRARLCPGSWWEANLP